MQKICLFTMQESILVLLLLKDFQKLPAKKPLKTREEKTLCGSQHDYMQEAGTKLVDGQQQQHLAMKLNFLKTMWGIFPQSTLLQQTCKPSMKF